MIKNKWMKRMVAMRMIVRIGMKSKMMKWRNNKMHNK